MFGSRSISTLCHKTSLKGNSCFKINKFANGAWQLLCSKKVISLEMQKKNKTHRVPLKMERRDGIDCFNMASPVLLDLLKKLQSLEGSTDVDQHLHEHGSVQYHIKVAEQEPRVIYVSVLAPALQKGMPESSRLPDSTLRNIQEIYSDIAEVTESSREGFAVTVKFDLDRLPHGKKNRLRAISKISSIPAVISTSQLKDILWNFGTSGATFRINEPTKLVYHPEEPFFIVRKPDKFVATFPMRFQDEKDVALATTFFQKLAEVGDSTALAKAPVCTWSPIPPPELRGESIRYLSTNGGFVSFEILHRHIKGEKSDKTVWVLLNFNAYVKYHVKCTKSFIQRKMRQQLESLKEVIEASRIKDGGHYTNVHGDQSNNQQSSLKLTKLKRTWNSVAKNIKSIHPTIRIRALQRMQGKWRRFKNFVSLTKHKKLQ